MENMLSEFQSTNANIQVLMILVKQGGMDSRHALGGGSNRLLLEPTPTPHAGDALEHTGA